MINLYSLRRVISDTFIILRFPMHMLYDISKISIY